jgi:hypothetical protein
MLYLSGLWFYVENPDMWNFPWHWLWPSWLSVNDNTAWLDSAWSEHSWPPAPSDANNPWSYKIYGQPHVGEMIPF